MTKKAYFMKVAVWDTYVERQDKAIMHFDILAPASLTDEKIIYSFGKEYLDSKPFSTGNLSAKECRFCHIEEAPEHIVSEIEKKGYTIIEMENCG